MYQCLLGLGLVSGIEFVLNPEILIAFRFLTFEVMLTESGLKNYEKVIAVVFDYLRIVKDVWLKSDTDTLDFFKETKTISDLSNKIYNVPD